MSKSLGPALPPDVRRLLDGSELDRKIGFTIVLVTVGASGWPNLALLSAGEVVAVDAARILVATWSGSATTSNLRAHPPCTLFVVHGGAAYYIRARARPGGELGAIGQTRQTKFELAVEDCLVDAVPYATLRTGIEFALGDPQAVLARWRATVAALTNPGRTVAKDSASPGSGPEHG